MVDGSPLPIARTDAAPVAVLGACTISVLADTTKVGVGDPASPTGKVVEASKPMEI